MASHFYDVVPGRAARVVFSHNLAFFTGHAAPQYPTLQKQTEAVLKRYEELFDQFGLLKKNIIYAACYLKNADEEEEFARAYTQWCDPENPPAGYTVTGIPIQHSPVGDNVLVELQFIVATDPEAKIKRYDIAKGCRVAVYDGMAYFTGHVSPKEDGAEKQTQSVLARYEELFKRFHLKKENVVAAYAFLKNADQYEAVTKQMADFFGENPPAAVIVGASPNQNTAMGPRIEIELALFVATGEKPDIVRRDVFPGMSRVVEYNGLAWFSAHCASSGSTLKEQTAVLAERYSELFEQFGYKRENVVMAYGYVRDIGKCLEFEAPMSTWRDQERPPAGVLVEAGMCGPECHLELQFIVSVDESE
ncbi:MAG: Rid family hydrolase [Lachnospiraceae bacterium]|nr:Rid family hydrolase [Lachnospiraceae bacterium]